MAEKGCMAERAECDQVLFGVRARVTAKFFVVDFQVRHLAARLTTPAVTAQYLLPQTLVLYRIQPETNGLRANRVHEAFSLMPPRNACC